MKYCIGLKEHKENFFTKDIESIMQGIDTDGNGNVNYTGDNFYHFFYFFGNFYIKKNFLLQLLKTISN